LNFSPIQFDDREIQAGRIPYGHDGAQVLRDLREGHRSTHVIRREGADTILSVAVAPGSTVLGEPTMVRLSEHQGLAADLIQNALLNLLADLGRTSRRYNPIQVLSQRDLLRVVCPAGMEPPDWLSAPILYEVAIRPVDFSNGERFIAAILRIRTTRVIRRTAWELLSDGMRLQGVYVGRPIPSNDPRIAPGFEVLGCVRSVAGSQLLLTDSRDGIEIVEAAEALPMNDLFNDCLRHVFEDHAPEIAGALERERADLRQGPAQLNRVEAVLKRLQARQYEMVPGVPFIFRSLLDDSMREFPAFVSATRPIYVFDGTGTKTHRSHDRGLNIHGPYTANVGSMAPPNICVVCQRSRKMVVEQFLQKLFFEGVVLQRSGDGKRFANYFERAFCSKYLLGAPNVEYFLADGGSAEDYHVACQGALAKHGNGRRWDVALLQIEEAFHDLSTDRNPYITSKASFQSLQIPVQAFEIETTRKGQSQLSCCLNNIGLAMYAKLGAIPWLIKAKSSGFHELVIGLGCADVGVGRFGRRERSVGVTTVFSGDGNYHLYNTTKAVSADRYREALLNNLRASIDSVRSGMNWRPGDQVLLVFHAKFKHFSAEEIRAVADLIAEFGEYDVRHAFLHVHEQHPFMIFDTGEDGAWDGERRCAKGRYAPARGRYLRLGAREVLLSLTGPKETKRPEDGTPQPLLLSLHRDSSFTDVGYLTEQVFAFSWHSWRTFLPVSLPITVQYPNLIANSLGRLSRLPWWNPDVMLGQIGKGLWFL
jgi:hypothetical protein